MAVEAVWLDWMRCLDEIAALRAAPGDSPWLAPVTIGDHSSDEMLWRLASLMGASWDGVSETCTALADEATLTVLTTLNADRG